MTLLSLIDVFFLSFGSSISCKTTNNVLKTINFADDIYSNGRTAFSCVGGQTTPLKVMDNQDGYVYYSFFVYKSAYTENSDLYLLDINTSFTPGYIAYSSGYTNYHQEARLGKGTVIVKPEKYQGLNGSFGGNIAIKAFWPKSTTISTTITSSYSTSFSSSCTFGYGSNAKISLGGGLEIGASDNRSLNAGFQITSQTTTSSTFTDPLFSSQLTPSTPLGVIWNYDVQNPNSTGKLTFEENDYLLIEKDHSYAADKTDAFKLVLDINTTDKYWITLFFNIGKWGEGTPYSYSSSLDYFVY